MTGPLIVADGDVLAVSERIAGMLSSRRGKLGADEVSAIFASARGAAHSSAPRRGKIAVVPIRGYISQHFDLWGFGTSTVAVGQAVRAAAGDATVEAILLDVDSGGGGVYGVPELAAIIREVRAVKPVIAAVNSVAGSAAYWLAAQASEIIITPSGEAGSVGVYMVHVDESRALEQQGLVVSLIASDPTKTWGSPTEPLAEGARAWFERRVRQMYDAFVADVVAGRGVRPELVRRDWRARMFGAVECVALGLADRVGVFEVAAARAVELGQGRTQMLAGRAGLLKMAGSAAERDALARRFRAEDGDRGPRPFDRRDAEAKLAALGLGARPAVVAEPAPSNEDADRQLALAQLRAM